MDAPANLAEKLLLPPARDNPVYAEALAKKTLLRERRADLRSAIDQLQTRIAIEATPLNKAEFEDRVDQALTSNDATFDPLPDIRASRLELGKLKSDLEVVSAALRHQSQVCEEIRDEISLKALAKVETEHKRAVAAIAQAMDDLRAAALREAAVRRELREAGYSSEFPSFHVHRINFYSRDWGVGDFAARVAEYLR